MNPKSAWSLLLATCRKWKFEPHDIAAQLDAKGRYEVELAPDFPLLIKRFHYTSRQHTRGATWHDRLELFLPLDGTVRFRMGDHTVSLDPGDLLVVENLKLHHVVDFTGFDTRVLVVSFRPEFVYTLGSPTADYTFLLPFYTSLDRKPHVLRIGDPASAEAYVAMTRLTECYFGRESRQFVQAGSKAYLMELLFHLARRFRASDLLKWEFERQQQRSLRFKPVFEHIQNHSADKLPVTAAARMVALSPGAFTKAFKQVAGMTLVGYLNHVRLAQAARLLRETGRTVAEIAAEVGFSDQSYFDRRFKAAFGQTPQMFRRRFDPAAGQTAEGELPQKKRKKK